MLTSNREGDGSLSFYRGIDNQPATIANWIKPITFYNDRAILPKLFLKNGSSLNDIVSPYVFHIGNSTGLNLGVSFDSGRAIIGGFNNDDTENIPLTLQGTTIDFRRRGVLKMLLTEFDNLLIGTDIDTGERLNVNGEVKVGPAVAGTSAAQLQQVTTLDSGNVKLSGNQTIAGVKTFSSSPIVPIATTNFQAIPLAQVNTLLGSYIKQGGNSFGAPVSIGSLDDNMVRILVNSLASVKFSANQMDVGGFGGYKIINGTTEINISVGFTRLTATPVNGSTTPAHTFRKVSSANTVVDIVSYFGGSSGNTVMGGVKDDGSTYTVADFESTTASKGIILKSPNGTRYRITVSDTGVLTTTAI